MKTYEFRDPVHGFIKVDDWELELINHPVFQRLRRINQLGFTGMVYPGANHTRFEHSLGVMHVATRMFENIVERSKDLLIKKIKYDQNGINRDKKIVRLAALLHDIGHTPFSHAGEGVMPPKNEKKKYEHEDYSAALIRVKLKEIIEDHPRNQNFHIKADDIANLIEGNPKCGRTIIWKDIISSQLDADRSDYLLRDSLHLGVNYGKYDLNRLLVTLKFEMFPEESSPRLTFDYSGVHAVEALIIARYMMFTQVYFQKTRRAYDFHYSRALEKILKEAEGTPFFPPPDSDGNLEKFIQWDDWKVGGYLHKMANQGEEHSLAILARKHYRVVHQTSEQPDTEELTELEKVSQKLEDTKLEFHIDSASSAWYKFENKEICVLNEKNLPTKLSNISNIVRELKRLKKIRIYIACENREKALNLIKGKDKK